MNLTYPGGTIHVTAQNSSNSVKGRDQETKRIVVKEDKERNKKCFELSVTAHKTTPHNIQPRKKVKSTREHIFQRSRIKSNCNL